MTTLTIRIPEDKHDRLKALAQSRHMSANKPMDELATVALANHDAFLWFQPLVAQGNPARALELLDQLGAMFDLIYSKIACSFASTSSITSLGSASINWLCLAEKSTVRG